MSITPDLLSKFELLAGLPDAALETLAQIAQLEEHPDGALIIEEDQHAEKLFLLLSGKIALEKKVQLGQTGTPRQATIDVIGPWGAFGWSSIVPPYTYTASGICLEDSKLLSLNGSALNAIMQEMPEVGYELIRRVATLIRDRLTSASSMLTYFLSIVSHELKRPIAAVENYVQVLLGGFAGEISAKQSRLLERSALRLGDLRALISDILDFARMQPEQIRADFELLNPQEIGAEAIEDVRLAATQKQIRLKAIGPATMKPLVGAHRRLRQVLSNLLANAVKFSPEGSTVVLSVHDDEHTLSIDVTDEGIGIPLEDQAHIFEDFYRASNAETVGGAGLGLSIAKKIVDAHEGEINVQSPYEPGKPGTRFTVRVPRNLPLPASFISSDQGTVDPVSDPDGE